jgi:hypothetical protein
MSHFAKIENNIVTNVIVAEQDFIDSEAVGDPTTWIEILDNDGVNKYHAGIGFTYDAALDAFIPPKPFNSWILDGAVWNAPVKMPTDEKHYMWNEEKLNWIEMISVLPVAE